MRSEDVQGVAEAIRAVADALVMVAERSPQDVGIDISHGLDNLGNVLGNAYPHAVGNHHGALVVKFRWDGPMFVLLNGDGGLRWHKLPPTPEGEERKP